MTSGNSKNNESGEQHDEHGERVPIHVTNVPARPGVETVDQLLL